MEMMRKMKTLPTVSKDYDKEYIVIAETISQDDKKLLLKSDYIFRHRANICMIGSTHSMWRINPYKKEAGDAALKDATGITFTEFLRLVYGINDL